MLLVMTLAVCVQATPYTWDGDTSQSWNNTANWTNFGPPGFPSTVNDDAQIPDAPFDPLLDSDRSIRNLTLNNNGRLRTGDGTNNYKLILAPAGNTSIISTSELIVYDTGGTSTTIDFKTHGLDLETGGELTLEGAFISVGGGLHMGNPSEVTGSGTIELTGNSDLTNSGIIRASGGTLTITKEMPNWMGTADFDGTTTNPGELRMLANSKLVLDVPMSADRFRSQISVRNNAELEVHSAWRLSSLTPGGSLLLSGGDALADAARVSGAEFSIGSDVTVSGQARIFAPAVIVSGSAVNVQGSATLTFENTTTFSETDAFSGTGMVRLNDNSTVTTNVTVNMPGGKFDLDGDSGIGLDAITVNSGNEFILNVAAIDSSPDNPFEDQLHLLTGGKLEVNLTSPADGWIMAGTLDVHGGGSGDISLAGSDVALNGNVTVDGSTNFDARIDIGGTIDLSTPGTTLVLQGGNTTDRNTLASGTVSGSGVLQVANGAALEGDGNLPSTLNTGILSPGMPVGTMDVAGNFTQSSAGVLEIEVGGSVPGSGYDQLLITGDATLDGTLLVTLIDAGMGVFEPAAGDSFQILTATGGVDGMFSTESLPNLSGDLEWQVLYLSNSVQLVAALPGDYNRNGVVDAADYVIWRKAFGQTVPIGSSADGNADGQITSADYDVWKAHFGRTNLPGAGSGAGSVSSQTAVPEPGTVLLGLMAFAAGTLECSRWRKLRPGREC